MSNEKIIGKINDKTKTTLDVIKDNPTATIVKLSELTGKSQSTISRELKEYQAAGLIRREGARKNGRWVVK
jgi:DNA-binding Lrp family transcriptional regulator